LNFRLPAEACSAYVGECLLLCKPSFPRQGTDALRSANEAG